MKQSLKILAGSVIVYVVVAACAATEHAERGPGSKVSPSASSGAQGDEPQANDTSGSNGTSGTEEPGPSVLDPVAEALAEDGSRLRARFYRATDGSKQWAGAWWDSAREEECTFRRASDGKLRCLPATSGGSTGYFANSTCTEPLYLVQGVCAAEPVRFFTRTPTAGCNYPELYAAGAEYTSAQMYAGEPGNCSAYPHPYRDSSFYKLYRGGAAVNLADYVEASVE